MSLWSFYLLALIGATIHIIGKWAELEQKKRKFNPKKWMKKHMWRTTLGFLLSVGGVVMLNEIGQLSEAAVLLMGYTGDSLLKKGQKQE